MDFTPTGATARTASTADDTRITIGNRYEGAEVVYREGYYYLFGSATNCYAQAGLVVNGDDDNFVKLTDISIWETRQTEFAKEKNPVPAGFRRPSSCEPRPSTPASSRSNRRRRSTPWWTTRTPALLDLAHAALDELAEELLWHATRDDVATQSDFR